MMKTYARIDGVEVVELFATDGDITEMFHPDLVWVEIPENADPLVGWVYEDGEFSPPPPPTEEELEAIAGGHRAALMVWASQQIAPLQDAVDLEEATTSEQAELKAWKQYRISLNRLDQQPGWPTDIQWPVAPEVE